MSNPKMPRETDKSETVKRRSVSLTKNASIFQTANEGILHLFDTAVSILNQGIAKGSVDMPLGILSLMLYADLLHGGAYTVPINQLPYHMLDPTTSPYYAGQIKNTGASEGLLGWLINVLGVTNAGPAVTELFDDGNVPHVLPKLISDQTFACFQILVASIGTTDIFKSAGTGVVTYVEAAHRAAEIPKELTGAIPNQEQLSALMPLLKLLVP